MKTQLWHRRIAVVSSGVLLLTALTGLLWAYAPHLYFRDGYLKKKSIRPGPAVEAARLTPREAISKSALRPGTSAVTSVSLRVEGGRLVYEIIRGAGMTAQAELIDANSGERLSPIGGELASLIAAEYVVGNPAIKDTTELANYRHRSGKVWRSVYRVAFVAPRHPAIYIDRYSGTIVEESDDARAFHFWVMKLHQLQFFGTKKELTLVPGMALLLLVASGAAMLFRRWRALR